MTQVRETERIVQRSRKLPNESGMVRRSFLLCAVASILFPCFPCKPMVALAFNYLNDKFDRAFNHVYDESRNLVEPVASNGTMTTHLYDNKADPLGLEGGRNIRL